MQFICIEDDELKLNFDAFFCVSFFLFERNFKLNFLMEMKFDFKATPKEKFSFDEDVEYSSGSDFDDDEDPDKIEVPGMYTPYQIPRYSKQNPANISCLNQAAGKTWQHRLNLANSTKLNHQVVAVAPQ